MLVKPRVQLPKLKLDFHAVVSQVLCAVAPTECIELNLRRMGSSVLSNPGLCQSLKVLQ